VLLVQLGKLWPYFQRLIDMNLESLKSAKMPVKELLPHTVCALSLFLLPLFVSLCFSLSSLSVTHSLSLSLSLSFSLVCCLLPCLPCARVLLECPLRSILSLTHTALQVTRRFAEFIASLLTLNSKINSEQIQKDVSQLIHEYDRFIVRHATELKDRKEQTMFLMNNYDHVRLVLSKTQRVRVRMPHLV